MSNGGLSPVRPGRRSGLVSLLNLRVQPRFRGRVEHRRAQP
jgi:hypothetical protein